MKFETREALLFAATLAIFIVSSFPCEASFSDNGDGTVTQTMADGSRLMWLKDANLAETTGYPAYGSDLGGVGMSFDDCIAWVASVPRRFSAWAVRDMPPLAPAVPGLSPVSLAILAGLLSTAGALVLGRRSRGAVG